jgi:transposase-like protein
MPRRRRHTPDQIIRKLAEGNKLLAGGAELDAVCRHLEIAESTWHRWLAQYGGMKASDAKRLKELEVENTRLKKLNRPGFDGGSGVWITHAAVG